MTCSRIAEWLKVNHGKGEFHARALIREVIKKGNPSFQLAREFQNSPRLTTRLRKELYIPTMDIVNQLQEPNGTLKFVTQFSDGLAIESVVIPMKNYNTLCVSTQVGCRMGCVFCETAKQGFQRNLAVHEITGQLFTARFILKKNIKNIVFMGMGEPFDNLDALFQAIRVFNDPRGFDIALRHMTVSTCGVIPGIKSLARQNMPQLNLAVSINSADDHIRSMLMPINRHHGLEELKKALIDYPLAARRVIFIEYILIKGINDTKKDAEKLVGYLSGLTVRVNLIAYNPGPATSDSIATRDSSSTTTTNDANGANATAAEAATATTSAARHTKKGKLYLNTVNDEALHQFAAILEAAGLFVVKRWAKGRSLQAGCGQLSGKNNNENKHHHHSLQDG